MNNIQNKAAAKKYKFNIVDVAVIVLIFIAIISLILIFDPFHWVDDWFNTKEVTVEYVIEFKALDDNVANRVNVHDVLIGEGEDKRVASITNVETRTAFGWIPNHENGVMEKSVLKNKKNLFVTVEVDSVYKEGEGYFIGKERVAVGSQIKISFPTIEGTLIGYCVSMKVID